MADKNSHQDSFLVNYMPTASWLRVNSMSPSLRHAVTETDSIWNTANHHGGEEMAHFGETHTDPQNFHPEVTTLLLLICHWPHASSIITSPLTLPLRARQMCSPRTGICGKATCFIPRGQSLYCHGILQQRAEPCTHPPQTGRPLREQSMG